MFISSTASRFTLRFAAAGLLSFSFAVAAPAAELAVDWRGEENPVSTAWPFRSYSNGYEFGGFASGDPLLLSPPADEGDGGPLEYEGGPFYGAVTTGGASSAVTNSTRDRIELKGNASAFGAVVLWRQNDFLSGLDVGNVGFDGDSVISMNIATHAAFGDGRVVIRLQGGSQDGYYISSEAPFDDNTSYNLDPTSLTWLAYDPASDLNTFGSAVDLLSNGFIEHVTEVGFYFRALGTTSSNALRVDLFQVTASQVPEPAAFALLSAGMVTLLARRR